MASATMTRPISKPALAEDHVPLRTWICVLGVLLGCFMAVLDVVITNSSLRNIAGALGASSDEISWVPTSYLVAEIVVIPLTAWLSQAFSLKRYLLCELNPLFGLLDPLRTSAFARLDDHLPNPSGLLGRGADSLGI